MTRRVEIRLTKGDVELLRVEWERGGGVGLLVYQRPEAVPLIQTVLSEDERAEIVRALSQRGCIRFGR